jgi:uncharacterized protein YodC (DUF2158 family)
LPPRLDVDLGRMIPPTGNPACRISVGCLPCRWFDANGISAGAMN